MKALVDTTVWSLALQRRRGDLSQTERALVLAWRELVREGGAAIIGPVRQEVLSGLRDEAVFERLRDHLRFFEDEPLTLEDFEEAACCDNRCRSAGAAGTAVDFLVCAVAIRRGFEIFTTDEDFALYAEHLPIELYTLRGAGS